ncbi:MULTISPECIES: hypothetical protein [Rhodonellum]|nr:MULTISPECIES: hypothetical protein [Rhodonellum]SDY39234.1 hypothetical protein SAMN05444412_1016 [Rhodonellum ikkaensis]
MKTKFAIVLLTFFSISCMDQGQTEVMAGHFLVGNWTNFEYEMDAFTMEKSKNLASNVYGYSFRKDGTLIQRSNSGWCGTPPVVTSDFQGTWRILGEEVIIEAKYWGGISVQTWKVTQLSNKTLRIEILSSEYREE